MRAVLVAVLLAAGAAAAAAPRTGPVRVDEQAPDFSLGDQHGKPLRLSDAVRNRDFVVLAFYVKAFTGGWDLEFARFRDDQARYAALGAEIIGISADPPDRNLAWTRELKLPFRLLSDPEGEVSRQYGVWDDTWNLAKRVTFIVDRSRRVRWVDAGGLAIDTSRTLEALTRLAGADKRR